MVNAVVDNVCLTDREQVFLRARINAPILPLDRNRLYEEPLEILLKIDGLGEVISGDTVLAGDGSIACCEIEIEAASNDQDVIDGVIAALEEIGAPKGSMLIIEGETEDQNREIPFGQFEGMAVRLGALKEKRAKLLRATIEDAKHLLGQARLFSGYREAQNDCILYIYGRSFSDMRSQLVGGAECSSLAGDLRIDRVA